MRQPDSNILKYYKRQKTKFLNNWRFWYLAVFASLIVLYPNFVSDGQGWKYVKDFGIEVPAIYKIHGIDVSWHNGDIDWTKLNSNRKEKEFIEFIFIKATEGSDIVDVQFKKNWQGAKANGFRCGAYHFFNSVSDPKLQALNYIINTDHNRGDLYPVLDFETIGTSDFSRKKSVENAKIWLEVVEKEIGVKPIIYTNNPIYRNYLKDKLDGYPIWISDYVTKDVEAFTDPNMLIWQHTDSGKLNGINGKVDFNVFLGTPNELNKIIL